MSHEWAHFQFVQNIITQPTSRTSNGSNSSKLIFNWTTHRILTILFHKKAISEHKVNHMLLWENEWFQ